MKNEIIWKDDRELTKIEYANLSNKANNGVLPVEYFRKNLFNATTKISKQLKRNKTIYDDGNLKIQVNRSLHQKHRDLLSIIFLDNKGIKKPNKDGSYLIFHNLYDMAKKMGYKKPKDSVHLIKEWLNDLRFTDIIYSTKRYEQGHMMLGKYMLDRETGRYAVKIPSDTAKYHILNYVVQISKEINRKIVAIPNKYAKTKALVSYILSNKALKNGIKFNNVCDNLDILGSNRKSEFKKEIIKNKQLLKDFNIVYDEENQIIKYQQLENVVFYPPVKEDRIIKAIKREKAKQEEANKPIEVVYEDDKEQLNYNEERYKKLITNSIDTKITLQNQTFFFKKFEKNKDNQIILTLENVELGKMGEINTTMTTYESVFRSYFL